MTVIQLIDQLKQYPSMAKVKYADVFTSQWFDIEYANKHEDTVYLTEIDVTNETQ